MAYNQSTSYLSSTNVFRGNAIIAARKYGSSGAFTPFGALKDVSFAKELTISKEEQDNAQPVSTITKTEFVLKFKLIESLSDTINTLIWSGTETRTTVAAGAGAPATPANDQTILAGTATNLTPVPLDLGNDDGTVPTLTSVTAETVGVLAADDDYFLIDVPNSTKWQIYFKETGTKTVDLSAEDIVIVWGSLDQTASVSMEGGTGTALNDLEFTLTADNNDRTVLYNLYMGELDANSEIALAADDAEDRRNYPELTFRFREDNTYHSGAVYKYTINS